MVMLADLEHQAPWNALKAAGYAGAFGYTSHNRAKCPDTGYGASIVARGALYALVFEDSATRALEGYVAGREDAIFANLDADAQHYPNNAAIYWTADSDLSWNQVKEYARGWHEHSLRPVGVYADGNIIRGARAAGFVKYGWRTCSGGFQGSHDLTGVDLVQACAGEVGHVPVPGFSVDTNHLQPGVTDIGAWSYQIPPSEEDMTPAQEAKLDKIIKWQARYGPVLDQVENDYLTKGASMRQVLLHIDATVIDLRDNPPKS